MAWFERCLFYLVLFATALECANPSNSVDKKDWVDPGDMLRYDSATRSMKPILNSNKPNKVSSTNVISKTNDATEDADSKNEMTCAPAQKCQCPPAGGADKGANGSDQSNCDMCDMKFAKRFVKRLIHHFMYDKSEISDDVIFDVKMRLNKLDLIILETFANTETRGSIQETDEILMRLIQGVKLRQPNYVEVEGLGSSHLWTFVSDNIVTLAIASGILLFGIVWVKISSTKGYLMISFVIVILVSIGYEWVHLYQKLEANKFAERLEFQEVPDECDPSRISWYAKIVKAMTSTDRCKTYYQNMMVSSFYEINPMLAVTSMFGKMLDAFASSLGTAMSKMYANSIGHLSWYHGLIMFAILTILILGLFRALVQYAVWRPRQQHMEYVSAPTSAINYDRNYRGRIWDTANTIRGAREEQMREGFHHDRSFTEQPQQLPPAEWTRASTSSRAAPSSTNPNCHSIRTAAVDAVIKFTNGERDEVSCSHCDCRYRGSEAGEPIIANHTNCSRSSCDHFHHVPAVHDGGVAASSEQAEKIALIVSLLADELEKKARIGRTDDSGAASTTTTNTADDELPKGAANRSTDPSKRNSPEFRQSLSRDESTQTKEASTPEDPATVGNLTTTVNTKLEDSACCEQDVSP